MSTDVVISVDRLSKRYRLGVIGTGTLSHDLNRWWAKVRGKEDPTLKVGAKQKTENEEKAEIQKEESRNSSQLSKFQLSALSSDYIWALKDVSFDVKKGEVLGIIGGNGAGKSTLLKILSRVTAPTEGVVRMRGRVGSLLEVGTGFHPELTGRENVYLNGAILGMSKSDIQSKFAAIADFSEVNKYIDTPVKRYSSGMYVRLAFAVAAHLDPEILVVDEVLAVGDVGFQRKCLGKMHDISEQGRTVLFVSHNMAAISALCESAILLNQGCVHIKADAKSVVYAYLQKISHASLLRLEERTDRRGNGTLRFTTVELLDANGAPVRAWISGMGGRMRIHYTSSSAVRSVRLHFSIGLDDETGARIALFNNEICGSELQVADKRVGAIDAIVPRVRLPSGKYAVTLYSKVNGVEADWVVNAFMLDVQDGDFFGSGRSIPSGQSQCLIEHHFESVSV